MASNLTYQYFVEGECERKLIEALKEHKDLIVSGRVEVFNPVLKRFTDMRLRTLAKGTIVILVFDTDRQDPSILLENLSILQKSKSIKEVWCVPQCKDFEDELRRATGLKNLYEMLGATNLKDFKHAFVREKNLVTKLYNYGFEMGRFWVSRPNGAFAGVRNDGEKVKL